MTTAAPSWSKGYGTKHLSPPKEKKAPADYVNRFWLFTPKQAQAYAKRKGVEVPELAKEITFMESEGLVYYEHDGWNNNANRNWYLTCPGDDCPLCAKGDKPYEATAYTIVNHSEFTASDGTVRKNRRELLVAKNYTARQLDRQAKKTADRVGAKHGLRGVRFEAVRTGDKDAKVGGEFDILRKATKADITDEEGNVQQKFDFSKALALDMGRLTEQARYIAGPTNASPASTAPAVDDDLFSDDADEIDFE
jgi:hypothetical protein